MDGVQDQITVTHHFQQDRKDSFQYKNAIQSQMITR